MAETLIAVPPGRAGGDWPERARKVARLLSGDGDGSEDAAGVMLLADIRAIFAGRGLDRITSAILVEVLHLMEDLIRRGVKLIRIEINGDGIDALNDAGLVAWNENDPGEISGAVRTALNEWLKRPL